MSAKSGSKTNISRPPVLGLHFVIYTCAHRLHILIIWFPRGHRRTSAPFGRLYSLPFRNVTNRKKTSILHNIELLQKYTLPNFHNFRHVCLQFKNSDNKCKNARQYPHFSNNLFDTSQIDFSQSNWKEIETPAKEYVLGIITSC